ncbi:hypothetical protein F0562_019087 [Nyssa sinensis]|uniref:C2H2-type domain-containing protein n=1 Tax=Nyssa sinensis TaxID=561372 RepID=A0A5J4ZEH5_9ASTE|nr:hypothetical protein F0562_019087 [Nyssa sinensis]
MDDEDPASDWEDRGNVPPANKRMYALRTNPNRLKSCRVCENCGMEFLSWKSFLEHGKCSSEDAESLVSSPESDGDDGGGRRGCGWLKRKRTSRAKVGSFNFGCPLTEEEDLAKCLIMLSKARVDPFVAEPEESCASASKEEERRNPVAFGAPLASRPVPFDKAKGVAKGLFECKACKKVFNSHQALGGHRASHKKVKGCFAARLDHLDDSLADEDVITQEELFVPSKSTPNFQFDNGNNASLAGVSRRKSKVHECSICHRIFSSGQALGGHKRCHWLTSNSPETSKFHHIHEQMENIHERRPKLRKSERLDLNLPAPADDMTGIRRDPKNTLSFDVSTEINLKSWIDVDAEAKEDTHCYYNQHDQNNNEEDDENNNNDSMQNVEDEADSKVKLAKLSELKDVNISGSSSPWLQVGIGSTTDVGADPALGGHMRSHMLNLYVPPKTEQPSDQLGEETESASSSSSSEEEENDEKELAYGLRENPKRSIRLVDPEFSFAVEAGSVVLQDRESETESSKNPIQRRSKRIRRSGITEHHQYHEQKKIKSSKLSKTDSSWPEPEPMSSISDTIPEEDVAYCLMMLSRDKWKREEDEPDSPEQHEAEQVEKAKKYIDDQTDDSDEFKYSKGRVRGKYKCETCKRVFRSYQALGGHRASHKKMKVNHGISKLEASEFETRNAGTSKMVEEKIHECPVCYRVFSSGQALGGHKRSHVIGSTSTPAKPPAKFGENMIDLNLPAPIDDDDISQIELSAVSDAEFVNPINQ